MALSWPAKAPTGVKVYEWVPSPDNPIDSVTVAVASGTVVASAEADGDIARVTVSGGSAGVIQTLTLTAVVGEETIVETVYFPVEATTNRLGYTVRDICKFALRKVVGINEEPDADELADAIERLNDKVALYRMTGADIGVDLPLLETDTLYIPDHAYLALKLNLRNELHEFYGQPLSATDVMEARTALAVLKNSLLTHRGPRYY